MPEDWRSAVIIPLYKGKGERNKCKDYGDITLLSVFEKIYSGILVDRVCRVTGGLTDDEHWSFREGLRCEDKIFTLKQIGEKHERKNVKCMWVL